jgi:hypothetical protein
MNLSKRTSTIRPAVPDVPPVQKALERSDSLNTLMQRLRRSQQCMEAIRASLPNGLHPYVQAGPIDDEGWTLLVANAAVSAKLRQMLPRFMETLAKKGLKVNAIRLKVQTHRG